MLTEINKLETLKFTLFEESEDFETNLATKLENLNLYNWQNYKRAKYLFYFYTLKLL